METEEVELDGTDVNMATMLRSGGPWYSLRKEKQQDWGRVTRLATRYNVPYIDARAVDLFIDATKSRAWCPHVSQCQEM